MDTFRQTPCFSAGTSPSSQGFFSRSVLKLRAKGATLMRFRMLNHIFDGHFLSRIFTFRKVPFEKCTQRLGAQGFGLFNRSGFRRLCMLEYATQMLRILCYTMKQDQKEVITVRSSNERKIQHGWRQNSASHHVGTA